MAFVVSQLVDEVTAHAQSDSLEDAREICADDTYFLNNLRSCRLNVVSTTDLLSEILLHLRTRKCP